MLSLSCLYSQDHQEEADSSTEATVTEATLTEAEARQEASASLRHVEQAGDSNLTESVKLLDLHHVSTTATVCLTVTDGVKGMWRT